MSNDDEVSSSKPRNGAPRPWLTPLLAVIGLVLVIAALYLGISALRYNT